MNFTKSPLRPTATSFTPGILQHVVKRVLWHPQGITSVRWFEVVPEEATNRGRETNFAKGLHKTHGMEDPNNPRNSKIRDTDPDEAVPFKIPSIPAVPKSKPNLVRQKSYSNLNVSDACIPQIFQKADKFYE